MYAKKAEAKEPDIKDAVDYVLTFQEIKANFMEGWAASADVSADLKHLFPTKKALNMPIEYGDLATYKTPIDNPHAIELLEQLGFHRIEDLLERDNLFIRKFT